MDSYVFDSSDPDVCEDFCNMAYAKTRLASGPDAHFRMRIARERLGAVTIDDTHVGADVHYAVQPLGKVVIRVVHSGVVHDRVDGGLLSYGPGDVSYLGDPDLPVAGQALHAHCDVVAIAPEVFDQMAGMQNGKVRPSGQRPVSAEATRHLRSTIDHFRQNLLANPVARSSPLVVSAANQYLAACVLGAFESHSVTEPTAEDRRDGTPMLLRRAIAYIDDNAQNDIALNDIASAIYVTPRALQYSFRRHRDCTPMEYVRQVRLHYAHLDLVAGDRAGTSVSQVASRWGFAHAGRFAVFYRETYGQSPHTTLRN